jgi:hypothetical protein
MSKKGDVLTSKNKVKWHKRLNGLYHAAVVWDDFYDGSSDFNGIMLSKSMTFIDNINMNPNHFNPNFKFQYNNSHFVNQVFIKLQEWGPFYKVGELTSIGLVFIENNLTNLNPIEFTEYLNNNKI